MARTKKSPRLTIDPLPKAPFLYIHDPTDNAGIAASLSSFLPKAILISLTDLQELFQHYASKVGHKSWHNFIFVFTHDPADHTEQSKKVIARHVQETAIKLGCNFASVHLRLDDTTAPTSWGTHHMDLRVDGSAGCGYFKDPVVMIHQWLFTVLPIQDAIHLVRMPKILQVQRDSPWNGYEHRYIKCCLEVDRSAKVQLTVLILTKPAAVEGKKLVWRVADQTGIANFYFEWRGPSSQQTWDWLLSLKPGHLECLPRMPSVLAQEKLFVSIIKAPIRVPGTVIKATGEAVKKLGGSISKAGNIMQMGKRQEWVEEADVKAYLEKHSHVKIASSGAKAPVSGTDRKRNRTWNDRDSAKTTLREETHVKKSGLDTEGDLLGLQMLTDKLNVISTGSGSRVIE